MNTKPTTTATHTTATTTATSAFSAQTAARVTATVDPAAPGFSVADAANIGLKVLVAGAAGAVIYNAFTKPSSN